MYIKPNADAQELWDISQGVALDALLYPANEDVPCPWDAEIFVEGDTVSVRGQLLPGGRDFRCVCECTLPVSQFSKYFKLEIPDYSDDEEFMQKLIDGGWEVV